VSFTLSFIKTILHCRGSGYYFGESFCCRGSSFLLFLSAFRLPFRGVCLRCGDPQIQAFRHDVPCLGIQYAIASYRTKATPFLGLEHHYFTPLLLFALATLGGFFVLNQKQG
jgi:hypothetical protein